MRTVLLTGATGFVGKVVLEELLRRREELGIERVLALVRAGDPQHAARALPRGHLRFGVFRRSSRAAGTRSSSRCPAT